MKDKNKYGNCIDKFFDNNARTFSFLYNMYINTISATSSPNQDPRVCEIKIKDKQRLLAIEAANRCILFLAINMKIKETGIIKSKYMDAKFVFVKVDAGSAN